MPNYESLQHVFLIAMPQLLDGEFSRSVIYLWEYNEEGASGIIVNKPTNIYLGELLKQIDIHHMDWYTENYHVLHGGPVANDQIFMVSRQHQDLKDEKGRSVFEITVSSTREDLMSLAMTDWKGDTVVALGCSVWEPGQLDKELTNNDWLVAPFSEATLFGTAVEDMGNRDSVDVWYNAAARAGIDLKRLSLDVGHS